MNHEMTKKLVQAVLKSPHNLRGSVQGLGMMRTYLSDEIRLHIWDKSLKIPSVTPLHDHPWHLDSHIVVGELRQNRFRIVPQGTPSAEEFNTTTIKCGEGACTLTDTIQVMLRRKPLEVYREGEEYRQHKNEIHESFPVDGTVTIVTRKFTANRDAARVFWKGTGAFISAEPRGATSVEIERITERSLNLWF